MGFGAVQVLTGITKLSELGIDVDKYWQGKRIWGIPTPTDPSDVARKAYVDDLLALYLALTGGTMSGAIAMGTAKITGMGDPAADQDAATKKYVDDLVVPPVGHTTQRAIRTTQFVTASLSWVDVTGMTLNIDTIEGDTVLVAFSAVEAAINAWTTLNLRILRDDTQIKLWKGVGPLDTSGTAYFNPNFFILDSPDAGTHTYKLQMAVSSAATAYLFAYAANSPMELIIISFGG